MNLNLLEKIVTLQKKELLMNTINEEEDDDLQRPICWIEKSVDSISQRFWFDPHRNSHLSVQMLEDSRPALTKVTESFLSTFFPSGYPYSVSEGYLRYTQFRALQHFTSGTLSVLSTQSLLFAAGLRPTPAQATVVSWILKDGMELVGKLICSNLGARMDSEPKRWRILDVSDTGVYPSVGYVYFEVSQMILAKNAVSKADVLYDCGTGLEVMSPLCPHLFLQMAGLGNFAKGMAVVAARATRLPLYSSFAKEGNLSDLFAKGEAISTLFNVVGIGVGISLASTVCSSIQGKMIAAPLLSVLHVYSVVEEMRAVPVNTLNSQRTAMLVADFIKMGKISSPADLRYKESLLFPSRLIEDAGKVKIGRGLHEITTPSKFRKWKEMFPDENFVLSQGNKWTDMVLDQNATAEDALRGWLVAAYMSNSDQSFDELNSDGVYQAYEKMETVFPQFLNELKFEGWHTDRFLDGTGSRFVV